MYLQQLIETYNLMQDTDARSLHDLVMYDANDNITDNLFLCVRSIFPYTKFLHRRYSITGAIVNEHEDVVEIEYVFMNPITMYKNETN